MKAKQIKTELVGFKNLIRVTVFAGTGGRGGTKE